MAVSSGTPKVFVHGNPETEAVWEPLLDELRALGPHRTVRLSPPGFGSPLPQDFGATVEDYRRWLVAELEDLGEPVDLVGHDWGGNHVVNVAMSRPDLLRSWATDTLGLFDADYVWHELAQAWQDPVTGEEAVAELFGGTVDGRARLLESRGMPGPTADVLAAAQGADMGRAVLALYRSARQPVMAELGRRLDAAARRPGLALVAADDHFVGTEAQHRRCAGRAGAGVHVLRGVGHWWLLHDPRAGAAALDAFWRTLPGG